INCDPNKLSYAEQQRVTRTFVDQLHELIGPGIDIPAPDMGTTAQTMAWIVDQYSKYHGWTPSVVTGKPLELGGSEGREAATGRGLLYAIKFVLEDHGKAVKGLRFAVQGFGNVGSWACKFIHEEGGKVVAVSDATGALCNKNGIDIPALFKYSREMGSINGFPDAEPMNADELLFFDCDVLVPAALGHVLHKDNAKNVRAKFIAEGANGPTLPEADEQFIKEGRVVIPDIFANSGGVIVSYFEWVQNIQQFRWKEERVNLELYSMMADSYNEIGNLARGSKLDLRTAAFQLAISRVSRATALRGQENENFCIIR
ncbi:MAG TPA: Glu/Leu/Phe/Val dehydrogenase dimerization domain-containing protein, partial [Chroococcales cyanobacterium]